VIRLAVDEAQGAAGDEGATGTSRACSLEKVAAVSGAGSPTLDGVDGIATIEPRLDTVLRRTLDSLESFRGDLDRVG
jgi:hypothetical protein